MGFQAVNQHVPRLSTPSNPFLDPAVQKKVYPREWRIAIHASVMRVENGLEGVGITARQTKSRISIIPKCKFKNIIEDGGFHFSDIWRKHGFPLEAACQRLSLVLIHF